MIAAVATSILTFGLVLQAELKPMTPAELHAAVYRVNPTEEQLRALVREQVWSGRTRAVVGKWQRDEGDALLCRLNDAPTRFACYVGEIVDDYFAPVQMLHVEGVDGLLTIEGIWRQGVLHELLGLPQGP